MTCFALRPLAAVLLCTLLLAHLAPAVHAQESVSPACLAQTYDALAREERLFRSVLFGQKKAADTKTGSVRYDGTARAWLKKDPNVWRSLDATASQTDAQIESSADVPARRGIFEIKRATTSELLPPILQSVRAFQCLAAGASRGTEDARIRVQPEGCIEQELARLDACAEDSLTDTTVGNCAQVAEDLLEREMLLLKLAITYDSAYRTLLQFAGTFGGFLSDFRFSLLQPLWQTVRVVGNLNDIPCFLSQCDE